MLGRDERIPSGCAIAGFINEDGRRENGAKIKAFIANMRERSNGLGGGFAAYGIYPQYRQYYALHMIFATERARTETETYLAQKVVVYHDEAIPTKKTAAISNPPLLWRYFVDIPPLRRRNIIHEECFITDMVMTINSTIDGAFVASSGKDMGAFKAVGYPEDVAEFYRLEEYEAYMWTAHGRFPTNTPGWWGGAHPFSLLDWSVVHNGEISSYGINYRYLEEQGYRCSLMTDTEVVVYAFDLLVRKHGLPVNLAAKVLAAPFWKDIDKTEDVSEREVLQALREVYGSLLLNGPFSVLVARTGELIALTDRIKLRPMVAARQGATLYLATEEAAIREVCPQPDKLWIPDAGQPVVGRLQGGEAYAQTAC